MTNPDFSIWGPGDFDEDDSESVESSVSGSGADFDGWDSDDEESTESQSEASQEKEDDTAETPQFVTDPTQATQHTLEMTPSSDKDVNKNGESGNDWEDDVNDLVVNDDVELTDEYVSKGDILEIDGRKYRVEISPTLVPIEDSD